MTDGNLHQTGALDCILHRKMKATARKREEKIDRQTNYLGRRRILVIIALIFRLNR